MSQDLNLKFREPSPIGLQARKGGGAHRTFRERWSIFRRTHRESVVAYTILAPMLLYFMVFSLFPLLFVVYLSFTEWNGMMGWPRFIGLRNYMTFFTTSDYIITLFRTGIYGFIILLFTMTIGFLTALLLNQKIRGVGLIRTIWYLPVLVPFSVISQMMNAVLNPVDGIVMTLMKRFMEKPIVFQVSTFWMSFWIIALCIWKFVGGTVILYLAGLQSVDFSLYEAAKVDGANRLRLMWNITIPAIRPITMFVVITGIIGSFFIFEPVQLISEGGPHGTTNTILVRIFEDGFRNFSMGMASASSVVVLMVTLILSVCQYTFAQRSNTTS